MECWFKFPSSVGNVLINVTLRFVRLTVVAVKKNCFKYSECLFADFVMQQAKRMRHIIFRSVACLSAIPFTFFQVRQFFEKKNYVGNTFLEFFV